MYEWNNSLLYRRPSISHVNYLQNKAVKDLCIFLQLLSIQLGDNAPAVQMPNELRFNMSCENHRNGFSI